MAYKGNIFPGEHEVIIDTDPWEKAQAIFASNSRERSAMTRRQTPASLKGLVHCRHCQRVMTPSQTRGRLYRYYLCTGAAKNGHDACTMPSIPAGDMEGMVLDHLRALIHAPELMVRTWRAAKGLKESEVLETLRNLDHLWEQLFSAEQMRLTQLLVSRIEIGDASISLHLRTEGLTSLIAELRSPATPRPERKSA